MFGMSGTELIIILVVALILLGPDELPKAARTVGKTLRDIRRASDDLRDTFEREVMSEVKLPNEPPANVVAKAFGEVTKTLTDAAKDLQKIGDPNPPSGGPETGKPSVENAHTPPAGDQNKKAGSA
jgi:sec-independent protein translocase protein TatB